MRPNHFQINSPRQWNERKLNYVNCVDDDNDGDDNNNSSNNDNTDINIGKYIRISCLLDDELIHIHY